MTNKKKPEQAKKVEPKAQPDTYIMKVSRLDWGKDNKNHFHSDDKPLISDKVMGKYSKTLKVWLDNDWIEKGSYKK